MAWLTDIKRLSSNPKLHELTAFVDAQRGDHAYPDYKAMDLMETPSLVRHCWALDFRDGVDNRPTIAFSGTHIDSHYDMNITGKSFEEIYKEDDFDRAIRGNYYQVFLQKKASYTFRLAHYFDDRIDRYQTIEAALFPCSSDGETVNFGFGFVEYTLGDRPREKIFELF